MRKVLNLLMFSFLLLGGKTSFAQTAPTPEIAGDLFGCGGDLLAVFVDTVNAGNTYVWTVSSPATILAPQNGEAFVELPDTTNGTFILTLTEEVPNGPSTTVSAMIVIEQNEALVCDDNLNVSLTDGCELPITADVMLEGQAYPNDSYSLRYSTLSGKVLSGNLSDYIGDMIQVTVFHGCSGNSCWGRVKLEDKIGPVINCPDDLTISCFDQRTFTPPSAIDNCDNNVPVEEVSNTLDVSECTDEFSAMRTIVYRAKDDYGNYSDLCTLKINYLFEEIDSIKFPENRSDVNTGTYLQCDNTPRWDLNGNFYPDINETGYPTLNGNNIMESNGICKINSTYSDQRIDICDKSYKLIREWVILDWCTGKIVTGTQILKVLDIQPPMITCPPDSLFNGKTKPYECVGDFKAPPPIITSECSDSITYTIAYLLADNNGNAPINGNYIQDNVTGNQEDGYTIVDLPEGRTWVRYTVTDGCGNSTDCFTEIDILDMIPPIPVCDRNTAVGLTTVDFAKVYATTFDDGSYDNCGIDKFEVARMISGCGIGRGFDESTIFCCDDVGRDDLQVQLRVTDKAGNSNTCMVNVVVQDKADPIIECPDNVTIDCKTSYDISITGEATAIDNCPGVEVELTRERENLNNCYVGSVTRTWRATDRSENTDECSQRITIEDPTPFGERDIRWSSSVPDREFTGCVDLMTDPEDTGYPTWGNDECSQVTATHKDELFNVVDSVCFKILRRWTVIDWCTFDENNNEGIWHHVQVIKINNDEAPTFEQCRDITVCTEGPDCGGDVDLLINATDDCPATVIRFLYEIDLDNDGTVDRSGAGNDLSDYYNVGKHLVSIEAADGCGNFDNCEFILDVKDCKDPTPYCFTEITTVVMPSTEMIDIWASDFDNGSFDNCPGELKFSFSSDEDDTQRIFNCDDLGINFLEMWVTDEANNQDFCIVKVDIQSNGDACTDGMRISGKVDAYSGDAMNNVELTLTNTADNSINQTMTNEEGEYSFFGIRDNEDYLVSAKKDDNYMNGVSTLDLVLIQRHILGINELDSPFKLIAADVNNNSKITASDLVALRKLILGVDSKFTDNTSWRFVDGAQVFDDVESPWPFIEKVYVAPGQLGTDQLDFQGVKIGDVNESAKTNVRSEDTSPRSATSFELEVDNALFSAGELIKLDFRAKEGYELVGLQSTLSFDPSILEFVGMESGAIELDESNIGLTNVAEGNIATSWNDNSIKSLAEGEVLYSALFKAISKGDLKGNLIINSDVTEAEAYDSDLNTNEIKLIIRETENNIGLVVYQNTPNPFDAYTDINFSIPAASNVSVSIHDLSGKLVFNKNSFYDKGDHIIKLNSSELNASGVLTYTIETNQGKVTKKMVVLK